MDMTNPAPTAIDTDTIVKAITLEADDLSRLLRTIAKDAQNALARLENGTVTDGLSPQHARQITETIARINVLTGITGRAAAEEAVRKGAARRAKIEAGA